MAQFAPFFFRQRVQVTPREGVMERVRRDGGCH